MASAVVFLVYACILLQLLAAQDDSKPCVFPFIYKNNFYYSCTTHGSADWKLWCATTHNYDKDPQWKWCTTQEYGGNSHGRACVFPFRFEGKTYYTCATKKFDKPWCATTGSYDKDRKWRYCADTRLNDKPIGPCVFPFIFEGKQRFTCVTDGSSKRQRFCSLTKNYDADLQKVPCTASERRNCTFPFKIWEDVYCTCTHVETNGEPRWCATTSNYDKDRKWKPCNSKDISRQERTFGSCTFPFKYKGKTYYSCTRDDAFWGSLWCSQTSNYDVDKQWHYCSSKCLA